MTMPSDVPNFSKNLIMLADSFSASCTFLSWLAFLSVTVFSFPSEISASKSAKRLVLGKVPSSPFMTTILSSSGISPVLSKDEVLVIMRRMSLTESSSLRVESLPFSRFPAPRFLLVIPSASMSRGFAPGGFLASAFMTSLRDTVDSLHFSDAIERTDAPGGAVASKRCLTIAHSSSHFGCTLPAASRRRPTSSSVYFNPFEARFFFGEASSASWDCAGRLRSLPFFSMTKSSLRFFSFRVEHFFGDAPGVFTEGLLLGIPI
mmetsp:Transcript_4406/g.8116  ORF Transcript_4406/g.8116 Transcript_4406/m.8116 type:complete len:262 (-) Transcript_4406:176-961(-)